MDDGTLSIYFSRLVDRYTIAHNESPIGISCLLPAPWCTMVLVLVHHGAAGQVSGGEACGGDVVKLRITSRHPGGHSVHDNKQVLLPANAALKNSKLKILSFFSLGIWRQNV